MSAIIGFAGKGGTGKTTVASLVISWLVKNNKPPILAIDADPNSTLAETLGLKDDKGIVQIVDEFSREKETLPTGLSKERFFEQKIQELLNETDGFDLLSMGRPEGPGCYCYINNVLRGIMERLTKSYMYTVIDNEAGMEHLSRRTARAINVLFIISDETPVGIRSARRICDLVKELEIKIKSTYLIVNRNKNTSEEMTKEIKNSKLKLAGTIPEDEQIYKLSAEGKPVSELRDESPAKKAIDNICKSFIDGI